MNRFAITKHAAEVSRLSLPRLLELQLRGRRVRVLAAQLPHRERDGDAADHVEAHAGDGFAQIRDVLIHAAELGRVRHAQQASGEGGLGAQDPHDVVGARVRRLQRALDADHGFGKGGQLEALVAQILCEPFDEAEADGMGRS